MPEKKYRGVLFDFDGTLTSPGALDFPAIKREIQCPDNQPILEYLETLSATFRHQYWKILEYRERQAAEASRPNQGAEACLQLLKQKGIRLGILTRNSRPSVNLVLGKFQNMGTDDFSAIITRDEALPKPHPDGVLKAAEIMGIPIPELLVVGDFRYDIMAGKAAGATTALLTNGNPPVKRPGDPEPDFMIHNLEEVLSIVV
ncbi:MAG: HAD family hydrolase [Deltaproteobacteria bacterium]|nr:HAD family hydrolase [Deltaproteobacteria bacterium]